MTTGSKIQRSLGQAPEVFWAVYTDKVMQYSYIRAKSEAIKLANSERNRIGETLESRGDGPSRVRVIRQ